jgi:hydrogenase-4 membrane subunit HyfE
MSIPDPIDLILATSEIFLLLTAFLITAHGAVKGAILYYRIQSILLAAITGFAVFKKLLEEGQEPYFVVILIGFFVFLPLALFFSIEWLLARATIKTSEKLLGLNKTQHSTAERAWLRQISEIPPVTVALFLGLITLAVAVAFGAIPLAHNNQFDLPKRIGLVVSLSLFLTGLLNTATKTDLISQVIGLLTMDHGLYLAVVKIVNIPFPATLFILALYFYTFITIAIIFFIVPQVRYETGSIDLNEIAGSSDLEG